VSNDVMDVHPKGSSSGGDDHVTYSYTVLTMYSYDIFSYSIAH